MWGVKYRNGKLREYLKLDELNGLRRHHIKYQYDSFITEAVARLALGRRFSQATSDMKQSMKKDIVVILKLFFEKFTASPWMDVKSDTYSPIPTNLNKFLRRCCQIWLCDREGAPFLITQNDFLRIQCFYRYVAKYILPLYKLVGIISVSWKHDHLLRSMVDKIYYWLTLNQGFFTIGERRHIMMSVLNLFISLFFIIS